MTVGPKDPMAKVTGWLNGPTGCLPRKLSVGFLVSLTVLCCLYYIVTEDASRYLALPETISERMLFYDHSDGNFQNSQSISNETN